MPFVMTIYLQPSTELYRTTWHSTSRLIFMDGSLHSTTRYGFASQSMTTISARCAMPLRAMGCSSTISCGGKPHSWRRYSTTWRRTHSSGVSTSQRPRTASKTSVRLHLPRLARRRIDGKLSFGYSMVANLSLCKYN